MNLFKAFICLICMCCSFVVNAQQLTDTVLQLPPVEVRASRINHFSSGTKIEVLDSAILSLYPANNLADVLNNQSQLFVKSYGLGSLSMTSFRGAGAAHTAVLWNGFNLQNSMNGTMDMALIPAFFLSNVQLQYGAAGALWGSGAVGGTVAMNNNVKFNKGLSLMFNGTLGSFSDYQEQLGFELSKKRFASTLKIFNHDAKNDFLFINTAQYGNPQQLQSNAELQQKGLLQENYFLINKKQKLSTRFWYQSNDRNIPPSMTESSSTATQQDHAYRITGEWERKGIKLNTLLRAAFFDESLVYDNASTSLLSKSVTKTFIIEEENRWRLNSWSILNIGFNNTYNKAVADGISSSPTRNRFSVFANYKMYSPNNKWSGVLSVRKEFINNQNIPFIASAGISGRLFKYFQINANASQHYRLPTFNDLYWTQGGNPNLKPESGWSEEVGLLYKQSRNALYWQGEATIFNRNINDWILWLPGSAGIWTPDNVMKVWSRGVEYKAKIGFEKKKFKVELTTMYNYVLSTNEETTSVNQSSLGKQLIYVPLESFQGNLLITYRNTSINYNQVYTGYRFTTSDNSGYLEPFTLGNLYLAQVIKLKTYFIKVYAQLNNIWQTTYQVVEYRAMPLFNYQFGITLYYHQNNKNQTTKN